MRHIAIFTALLAGLLASACSSDSEGGGAASKPFEITVENATTWTADITWSPKKAGTSYIAMVAEKAAFDAAGSDAAYIESDIDYFYQLAEYMEKDFDEVLANFTVTGESALTAAGLKNDTDYYAYAYGIESDGTVTTKLVKTPFRTARVKPVDCTFEFTSMQVGSNSARVFVTPSDAECTYFWDCVTREEFDAFGDDAGVIDSNIDLIHRAVEIFQMAGQDKTFLDFLNAGPGFSDLNDLQGDTEYVVFAFALDPSGVATSALMKDSFRTDPVPQSSLTFATELLNLTFNGARVAFKPSNDDEDYFTDCVDYETYSGYASDEAFMASIVAQAGASMSSFLSKGYHILDASQMLRSNTRYVAYAFGYAGGITTGMAKEEFTTPAMPSGGAATMTVKTVIEDGNVYYARDEIAYAAFKDKAYLRTELAASFDAVHWYGAVFKADISGYDDLLLAEMLRTAGFEDKPVLGSLAEWGSKVSVAAVAVDSEGRSGAVARVTVDVDRSAVVTASAVRPPELCGPFTLSAARPAASAFGAVRSLRQMLREDIAPEARSTCSDRFEGSAPACSGRIRPVR